MKIIFKLLFLLVLTLSFFSCDDSDSSDDLYSKAENVSILDTLQVAEIQQQYAYFLKATTNSTDAEIATLLAKVKYDIVFSKVEYKAVDPFGVTKTLSGLLGYPILPTNEKTKSLKITSLQHGTLTYQSQAPSKMNFKNLNPIRDILTIITPSLENGYIIALPDYFGYGTDENNLHYYEEQASLVAASRGLINIIPDYAKQKGLTVNQDKLFLFGYSEGGFATMALLKNFSETYSTFKDYTTIAGAGGYDTKESAISILQQTTGDSPAFTASYAWVLLTYNKVYKINRDLGLLFKPNVLEEVKGYDSNNRIMETSTLPSEPINVFNSDFAKGLIDRTDIPYLQALEKNDVSNFDAKGSVDLVHGSSDPWVPPFNTDSAYNRLIKRGVNVTKTIFPFGKHDTTYPVFAHKVLEKLF